MPADLIEEISSHELEDEESSPANHKSNSGQRQKQRQQQQLQQHQQRSYSHDQDSSTLDEDDYVNRNIEEAAPVMPLNHSIASQTNTTNSVAGERNSSAHSAGTGSADNTANYSNSAQQTTSTADASGEPEGDLVGNIEQFVTQPASQGVLFKCRITRDRKGMDRGLFPIYYLHLERDYGKKIFLLGGKWGGECGLNIDLLQHNLFYIYIFFCRTQAKEEQNIQLYYQLRSYGLVTQRRGFLWQIAFECVRHLLYRVR